MPSSQVGANGTVVAGCSCARGVSKLLRLAALRRLAEEVPSCMAVNIVDDLAGHAIGGPRAALQSAGKVRSIVQSGMTAVRLPLSTDKTCLLMSDPPLFQAAFAAALLGPRG